MAVFFGAQEMHETATTIGSPYWLVFVMGIWVVASLGLGAKAIFFDAEQQSQFEE